MLLGPQRGDATKRRSEIAADSNRLTVPTASEPIVSPPAALWSHSRPTAKHLLVVRDSASVNSLGNRIVTTR